MAYGPGFGEGEHAILDLYRKNTRLQVPEPYFYDTSASELPCSYLIMQPLRGENTGSASRWMNSSDRLQVERQIAEAVAELHTYTRERFGGFRQQGSDLPWGEEFQHSALREYRRAETTGPLS
ncbi:MAG: phosphotransferase [Candidatus Latescibacteria bacterium]|nr:phosphotransferase [Candidatus Latescibacterota bacterium]